MESVVLATGRGGMSVLKATENLAMKLSEEELAKRAAAHRLFECPPDREAEIPAAEVFPGPRIGFYWRDLDRHVGGG